jgi:TonB family protein
MRASTTAILVGVLLVIGAPRLEAQASLDAARQLYASAEYDSALSMLDGLLSGDRTREERRSIELYRVLCLVATGRDIDAKVAVEALVRHNPLFRPTDEVPPRVRSVFDQARKRLLPMAVQTKYQEAKAAYDFKDYATAHRGFAEVVEVLADPDLAALANQSPLSDLRTLATGFQELSQKSIVAPTPVAAAPSQAPVGIGPVLPPLPSASAAPQRRSVRKVYSSQDPNVVPPIAVNQSIPGFPGNVRSARTGVIEVIIDDSGIVESATMLEPIDPQYDRMALAAAKSWQYQPAKVNGVPVKFAKRIQLSVVPKP